MALILLKHVFKLNSPSNYADNLQQLVIVTPVYESDQKFEIKISFKIKNKHEFWS